MCQPDLTQCFYHSVSIHIECSDRRNGYICNRCRYVSNFYRVLVDYLCAVSSVEGKNTGCYRSDGASDDSLRAAHKYHAVTYAFRTCSRCLGHFVGVSFAGGCVCVLCVRLCEEENIKNKIMRINPYV